MQITGKELTACKRAVLSLKGIADVAMKSTNVKQPLEMQIDILTLVKVLKRLEGEVPNYRAAAGADNATTAPSRAPREAAR